MVLRSWPSAGFGGRAPGLRPFRRVNSEGRLTLSCILAVGRVCRHSGRGASSMRSGWQTPFVSRSGAPIVRRESPNSCGGRPLGRARIPTRTGQGDAPRRGHAARKFFGTHTASPPPGHETTNHDSLRFPMETPHWHVSYLS